ncbi:conserved hypothetical protein [Roseibium sp. TrichSKD4]|uniref:hypothetical protein n=1 Tax=Roseibium sp. TrichSKD4 TaxID=744980 RepID=UPI0001E56D20|nr:hypothetical protein [Roseibium sp. TrichSKD4]EFO30246.1 conserved hypothetical protein [Roseibium sp. TrichSKD4]
MAGYVASKVRAVKDRLLGLWQHAVQRSGSAAGSSEGACEAKSDASGELPERGLQKVVLCGRDVPVRTSEALTWQDHRDELEVTGFLDQLPDHPLLAEECRKKTGGKS